MPDRKGSATAITNFTNGTTEKALLAVYEYEPRYMRFYVADVTAIGGNVSPWVDAGRYTGDLLGGDQYQNFALVTNTANQIYLLGFRENEELHVFRLVTQSTPFRVTGMVREATYKDWNNVADWRYGVGAQIVSSSQIRIFGTDKDPSGSDDDYSFNIYIYS